MLYFPIIQTKYPTWFPIASWRGQEFEFFSPVFNLADASISAGVIALLIWQKKIFPQKQEINNHTVEQTVSTTDETTVNTVA